MSVTMLNRGNRLSVAQFCRRKRDRPSNNDDIEKNINGNMKQSKHKGHKGVIGITTDYGQ